MSSTTRNEESVNAVTNQGEFHSKIERSSPPPDAPKHQAGKRVGDDDASEFTMQTLPAGSAPSDRTFQPDPNLEDTPQTVGLKDPINSAKGGSTGGKHDKQGLEGTSASLETADSSGGSDTMGLGATEKDPVSADAVAREAPAGRK